MLPVSHPSENGLVVTGTTESQPISLNLSVSTASFPPRIVSSVAICRNQSFIFDVPHRRETPFIFLNISNNCHKQSYLIRTRGGTFPSTFIDVGTILFSKPECPPSFKMKISKVLHQGQVLRNRLASVEGKAFIVAYICLFMLFGIIQRHYPTATHRKPRAKQV